MAGKHDKIKDKDRFSIITPKLDRCYVCGVSDNIMIHECFGGTANRKKSKDDGLVIPLCGIHHNLSNQGIHFNKNLDLKVKQQAQKVWMKTYGEGTDEERTEQFIKRYGRNYLD